MAQIFIVDNDSNHAHSLERLFRSLNHEAIVDQGQAGHEHPLRNIRYRDPDLIIIDIANPLIDALLLIHELQAGEDTNHIPVLVYTTAINRHRMSHCFDKGADHFFVKEDFPPALLLERLRKLYSI